MGAHGKKLIKARRRASFKHTTLAIHRDDKVQVIAGDDRGKVGKVLKVLPSRERVVIEGVNLVFKHMRRTQQSPQGGRLQREGAIHVSNVALLDPKSDKPTKVGFKFLEDGRKVRFARASGETIDR